MHVRERFYRVAADDAVELNRELGRQGRFATGQDAYALTRWRLAWSYVPRREGSRCTVSSPHIEIDVVTTLPKWDEGGSADDALAHDWSLFMDRLRMHESGHQDIALRTGSDLLAGLRELDAPDCDELRARAARVAADLSASGDADQVSFDRSTRYGLRVVDP
jgi:predicted secreted Zn-dependent protease